MNQKILTQYGLKFNPFSPEIPLEALHTYPKLEDLCWRIEHTLLREGGFALISGEPGTGKSVAMRMLAERLNNHRDVQVGMITHPSAKLSDFYRELGDVFSVPLNVSNRWAGFKNLRERWKSHMEQTLTKPVLFVDEAQEMPTAVLSELRLLTSDKFDSHTLLSVILAGDMRLHDKLRQEELQPLGSRIRVRYNTEFATDEELLACLEHLIKEAGNPALMTNELKKTLCEHAIGNHRALCVMANELLVYAAKNELPQMDEKLYFDCFKPQSQVKRKRA